MSEHLKETYTLLNTDTSATGKGPDVTFAINENGSMTAEPPGAKLSVELEEGCIVIMLTQTDTGLPLLVVHAVLAPLALPPYPEWSNPFVYGCEVLCALYWCRWRRLEQKRLESGSVAP